MTDNSCGEDKRPLRQPFSSCSVEVLEFEYLYVTNFIQLTSIYEL